MPRISPRFYSLCSAFFILLMLPALSQIRGASPLNIQINVKIKSAGYSKSYPQSYQMQQQSEQHQFLVVAEGYEARLTVSKKIPYRTWITNYLYGEGYLTEEIDFQNVGTNLVVSVVVRGNQLEVTLTPEISYEAHDGRGSVSVTSLSTTVLVPDGQTVSVGGSREMSEFMRNFYQNESGSTVEIFLTPRIMAG